MRYAATAVLLFALSAAGQQSFIGVYHEAWCPSVNQKRMTRLTRGAAIERRLIPAADCHSDGKIRYLGELDLAPAAPLPPTAETYPDSSEKTEHVSGYTKANGTHVND